MRFIGGPMHGLPVPEQHPAFTYKRQARDGRIRERMLLTVRLVGKPLATYQRTEWFVAPGRQLVPIWVYVDLRPDEFITLTREVFRAHQA